MITTTRIRKTPNTSSSTSITDTVNGEHDFKISNFSNTKGIGVGKHVSSDKFTVGGYSWEIYFYPDGKRVEDDATFVSLCIALASQGTDVRALFELVLLDQSGKERHKVHTHFGRWFEDGPYKLKQKGSMWGYKRYFRRSALERSDYLKDDCLLIHCRVGVIGSRIEHPNTYSIHVPPSDIGRHFGRLLECGKGTDVCFEVKGETFLAHKLVLVARSPVFRAQLFGPMRNENSRCIKIKDVEPLVFKALLHFLYWDSLPDMEELTKLNIKWTPTLMFHHLLAAADLYGLARLKLICEKNLCQKCCNKQCISTSLLCQEFAKL